MIVIINRRIIYADAERVVIHRPVVFSKILNDIVVCGQRSKRDVVGRQFLITVHFHRKAQAGHHRCVGRKELAIKSRSVHCHGQNIIFARNNILNIHRDKISDLRPRRCHIDSLRHKGVLPILHKIFHGALRQNLELDGNILRYKFVSAL